MSERAAQPGGVASADEQRIATLQSLTAALARLGTSAEVASFVLEEAARHVGARDGSLCLLEGDHLELVAPSNYPLEVVAAWRQMPLDSSTPAGECVLERRPVYCESPEQMYARYPVFRATPVVDNPSWATLPLTAVDGRVLGALVLGFGEPQEFSTSQRQFLEALAPEAGAALDRARTREELLEARAAAERASARLAFLAEASTRLAGSLDFEETMAMIAELAVPRVADRCVLYLLEESGAVSKHPLTELGAEELAVLSWRPVTLDDETGVGAVIRTGEAQHLPLVSEQLLASSVRDDAELAVLRRIGFGGMFVAALHARGQAVGALAFVNRLGRAFSDEERQLAEELAARAAVALDNARLFGRELRIAETLQHALLPDSLPRLESASLAARFLPGTRGIDVGGDWYDVVRRGESELLFAVGDVSGRGLSAARVMASLRHGIRAFASEGHSPAAILERMEALLDIGRDDHFATVLCGVLDLERRRLVLSNAGHLPPVLVAGDGPLFLAGEVAAPLGVGSRRVPTEQEYPLGEEALLLAFTDGLVERRGEVLDEGLARLLKAAQASVPTVQQPGWLEQFLDAVVAAMSPGGAEDDTAALALSWPAYRGN